MITRVSYAAALSCVTISLVWILSIARVIFFVTFILFLEIVTVVVHLYLLVKFTAAIIIALTLIQYTLYTYIEPPIIGKLGYVRWQSEKRGVFIFGTRRQLPL